MSRGRSSARRRRSRSRSIRRNNCSSSNGGTPTFPCLLKTSRSDLLYKFWMWSYGVGLFRLSMYLGKRGEHCTCHWSRIRSRSNRSWRLHLLWVLQQMVDDTG